MDPRALYLLFESTFSEVVLPYLMQRFPRDAYSAPIYHYLDNFQMRRFRSSLPVLIGDSMGVPRLEVLPIGAASELIFQAALVQDDIYDGDDRRGSIVAAHCKYGTRIAYAAGNYAYSVAIGMIGELRTSARRTETVDGIMRGFVSAQQRLCRSFLQEMVHAFNANLTSFQVRELYVDKTIQGVNALACTGMLVDDGPDGPISRLLSTYAELLGEAGQIKNDLYDIERYSLSRGYSDLRNGYMNYVLWELLHEPTVSPTKILELLRNGHYSNLVQYFREYRVLDRARQRINELVGEALQILVSSELPLSVKELLIAWAEGNRQRSLVSPAAVGVERHPQV